MKCSDFDVVVWLECFVFVVVFIDWVRLVLRVICTAGLILPANPKQPRARAYTWPEALYVF
jgi:hypothetical protein